MQKGDYRMFDQPSPQKILMCLEKPNAISQIHYWSSRGISDWSSRGIKSSWRIFRLVRWETENLRVWYMDAKILLVWWAIATHLQVKLEI